MCEKKPKKTNRHNLIKQSAINRIDDVESHDTFLLDYSYMWRCGIFAEQVSLVRWKKDVMPKKNGKALKSSFFKTFSGSKMKTDPYKELRLETPSIKRHRIDNYYALLC